MASLNPNDFSFHLKKGDLLPALKIKIYDSSTGCPFDLTAYTGTFYMALLSNKSTVKVNGSAVSITDAVEGEAEYRWTGTDTNTVETYAFEFRFTSGGKQFTIPTNNVGIVKIEKAIGAA
jgi:hypothetical protein